jgi:DNA-binding MarR family transcriptional regulator
MSDTDHLTAAKQAWLAHDSTRDMAKIELLARLAYTAKLLESRRNTLLKEIDLETWSYDTLAALRRQPKGIGMTPDALLKVTGVSSGTMTHRLSLLQANGLVRRKQSPQDGRSTFISLTPKGVQVIEHALAIHIAAANDLLGRYSADTLAACNRLLQDIAKDLQR